MHIKILGDDALVRQIEINAPGNAGARYPVQNDYDVMDRLTATHFPDDTFISNVYNSAGYLILTLDRAGRWTTNTYDAAGHLVRLDFPNGDFQQKSFVGDLVTSLTDGRGNVTQYQYDHEQLVGVIFPDGSKRAAGFDNLNRQVWAVDERGVAVTNAYDPLGRAIGSGYTPFSPSFADLDCTAPPAFGLAQFSCDASAIYPADSLDYAVSFAYDENGNVIRQTDWVMDVSNSYDALNRVTMSTETPRDTTDYPANTLTYAYDLVGKRTNLEFQVSSSKFQTGYTYDALDRLAALNSAGISPAISASYSYNPNGKLAACAVAAGSTPRFSKYLSYDSENRLHRCLARFLHLRTFSHGARFTTMAVDRIREGMRANGVCTQGQRRRGHTTTSKVD